MRIGSALAYSGVHCDGFSGAVQVPSHTRRITRRLARHCASLYQSVGAFSRQMAIPQRQFLGLSSDNQTELLAVIGDFWQDIMQ